MTSFERILGKLDNHALKTSGLPPNDVAVNRQRAAQIGLNLEQHQRSIKETLIAKKAGVQMRRENKKKRKKKQKQKQPLLQALKVPQ